MGRLVSPANIHTSSRCRPSRISWGCLSLQPIRTNKRSHVPAAAPSDSEADAFADKAAENLAIQFPEPDSSQYSIVEGESGEQEHGVRRNEDGDIEFAQRDSMGELTFEKVDKYTGLAIEAYDPMVNGKWVEIDGVDVKMPDYDFSQHDWMLRVETDIGWPMFWRYEPLVFACDSMCCLEPGYFIDMCRHSLQTTVSLYCVFLWDLFPDPLQNEVVVSELFMRLKHVCLCMIVALNQMHVDLLNTLPASHSALGPHAGTLKI